MPVSELAPTLASWDGSQPAAFGRERGEGGNGYTTGGLASRLPPFPLAVFAGYSL